MQPYAKSVQNYLNLNKKIYPYFFAIIFASFDLITKYFIRVNNIQEQVIIDNFLTIDLTYNTGIAFGLFSEYTLITYVFSIFVFTWLIFQFKEVENGVTSVGKAFIEFSPPGVFSMEFTASEDDISVKMVMKGTCQNTDRETAEKGMNQ